MFRRHVCTRPVSTRHVRTALAFVASLSIPFAAGCSDDEQATPRVTLSADLVASKSSTECPDGSNQWLTIGSFGNPDLGQNADGTLIDPVRPVDDGASEQQGNVTISCAVTPLNDGFNVRASAELSGATGGAFSVEGFFKPAQDNENITVRISRSSGSYQQTNCRSTFTGLQAVAAGRVWGQLDCDNIEAPSQQRVCKAGIQFRFENCTQ